MGTLCGKWVVDGSKLWNETKDHAEWSDALIAEAFRRPDVSHRPAPLRYVDPPHIKELIARRKSSQDPWTRAALMQEIHQLRIEAKAQHKEELLRSARSGDCRAIAHMRSSAAGGQSEGSYVQRAGGKDQAATQLFSFYQSKYSAPPELCPPPCQVQTLADRSRDLTVASVTLEEIQQALQGARHGVSAGLDGVTYEGIQHLLQQDKQGRIPRYFTQLIQGDQPLPESWKKGVQAADGVMAAQSTMQLLRQVKGSAYVAKIDIRAAFDSLSQAAVLVWLLRCQPAKECDVLYKLLSGTRVELSLAGQTRSIDLCRGLMQGTAYSADVFSRVMDYFLSPLSDRFDELFPDWTCPNLGLPHFIIYADDIMLFADTPVALQFKLQEVVDVLSTIGIWLRGRALPLQVESALVFLGIPLAHTNNVQSIMSHLMRRTQWSNHCTQWVNHWIDKDAEGLATFELAYKVLGICEHFGQAGAQQLADALKVLEVASSLAKEVGGPVALGAFVRVKAGVRVLSRTYPETTKLLTAFLASEFPGDFFLAIQVQVDVDKPPHKDVRNTSMPTLLVNLSKGASGGTWVEAPNGDEVVRCPGWNKLSAEDIVPGDYRKASESMAFTQATVMEQAEAMWQATPLTWTYVGMFFAALAAIQCLKMLWRRRGRFFRSSAHGPPAPLGVNTADHDASTQAAMMAGTQAATIAGGTLAPGAGTTLPQQVVDFIIEEVLRIVESKMGDIARMGDMGLLDKFSAMLSELMNSANSTLHLKIDALDSALQDTNTRLTRRFQVVDAALEKITDIVYPLKDLLPRLDKLNGLFKEIQEIQDMLSAMQKVVDTIVPSVQGASKAEQARFATLDGALKSKMDAVQAALEAVVKTAATQSTTTLDKLDEAIPRLQSAIVKIDNMPDKLDRTESLFRERVENLQQQVGSLMGSTQTYAREEAGQLRNLIKATEALQNAMVELKAAFGAPPADSPGITPMLELARNTDSGVQELGTVVQELSVVLTEIKDKLPDRPPYRPPPTQQGPQEAPVVPQAQQAGMPSVIDLSSRLPPGPSRYPMHASPAPGGVAVTFPSGRTMYATEDEILGYPIPGNTMPQGPVLQPYRRG
ncbi:pol [Symbiodinium necroappetens]|uniref:Pol protein n=1 Tax=Symbiodinium necroappetens TaxID=1628268 RepID=A0A812XHK5_9DINO|nr:pol [Symbiodinium necroappetens]